MDKKISSIYDVCRRNNQEILFNEATNQYLVHIEKAGGVSKFGFLAIIIMTIIIREMSIIFNPIWINLLTSNIFKAFIAMFLVVYICSTYIATRKYCINRCEKYCSIISAENIGLTANDIKNGEDNLKTICLVLFTLFFANIIVLVLFFKFTSLSLFVLLLLILFCLVFLYALALPQKRKRFYNRYKKKQSL